MVLVNSQKMFLPQGQIAEGPKNTLKKDLTYIPINQGGLLHCGQNKDLLSSTQFFWNLILRTIRD